MPLCRSQAYDPSLCGYFRATHSEAIISTFRYLPTQLAMPRRKSDSPPLPPLAEERYANWIQWTGTRWAWELLSRNKSFIEICDSLRNGATEEAKLDAALDFSLAEFKDCREPYPDETATLSNYLKPRFVLNRVTYVSRRANDVKTAASLTPSIAEVVIKFELTSMLLEPRAIEGQLNEARKVLVQELAAFQALTPSFRLDRSKLASGKTMLKWIKLLDAKAAGISYRDCAPYILDQPVIDPVDSLKKLMREAQKGCERNYYHLLAAHGDAPLKNSSQ